MSRLWIALVVGGLFAVTASPARADMAEDVATVRATMRQLQLAVANQDVDAVRIRLAADHVSVAPYDDAPRSVEDTLAALPDLTVATLETSELTVALLDADTALATYFVEIEGAVRGEPIAVRGFVTEIYVRRDGDWLQRLYQLTPLSD
jgi:ketosteroid isomerase-like protein